MHGDPVFEQPENMAVDGAGNVYVADSNHDKVVKFTSEGEVATAWGRPAPTTGSSTGRPASRPMPPVTCTWWTNSTVGCRSSAGAFESLHRGFR